MSTAHDLARALDPSAGGGRKSWQVCCPAHNDREPSLSIRDADGKVLVHCHAGCDQRDVIAALQERGLWNGAMRQPLGRADRRRAAEPGADQQQADRSAAALAIWRSTIPAVNTLVETYLARRGLTLYLPPSLRFHRGLKHRSGGRWPTMVALVTRGTDDTPLAIHRTFLAVDGAGKAPVEPARMMLGPVSGGAIRLAPAAERLAVTEGVETGLAVLAATGVATWAALSACGIRALRLPPVPLAADVVICADHDPVGLAAAEHAAERWALEGRSVRIATPPCPGQDFNDLATGESG